MGILKTLAPGRQYFQIDTGGVFWIHLVDICLIIIETDIKYLFVSSR